MVSSNECAASGVGWKDSYWSATVFAADQEVFVTIPSLPLGTNAIYIHGRIQTSGLGTSPNAYVLRCQPGAPDWQIGIQTLVAGVLTFIGVTVLVAATNFMAGVKIGFELIGSTLKGYRDSGAGWVEMISRTDTTFTGGGRIGLEINDSTLRFDNFGGGNVVVAGGVGSLFAKRLPLISLRRR